LSAMRGPYLSALRTPAKVLCLVLGEGDVIVLEEPEHICWFHTGDSWCQVLLCRVCVPVGVLCVFVFLCSVTGFVYVKYVYRMCVCVCVCVFVCASARARTCARTCDWVGCVCVCVCVFVRTCAHVRVDMSGT